MKKIIGLFFAVLFSAGLYAQEDVIKFLGIPVDGTKQEMIEKLKSKGFTYDQREDDLQGKFNGEEVLIQVQTQNNKVWRLFIMDTEFRSEGQIKIRFNRLVGQFENNSKYTPYKESQTIDENEDISYEISVNNKQYDAIFFSETGGIVWFMIGTYDIMNYFIAMFYESPKNEADGSDL
ncbi:MAG: hypothetical protein UHK52_08985 [Bacteroidales bacterium]|nr:hypothetical protein [Bacteroidales bacterium]